MKIRHEVEFTEEQLKGFLCTAFEGGSNYWVRDIAPHIDRDDISIDDFREGGKMQDPNCYWHWCQLVPLTRGCYLTFKDIEDDSKEYRLDREMIESGLTTMAEKFPKHFNDFVGETDDATTGDVFLQCCIFGDVIYG